MEEEINRQCFISPYKLQNPEFRKYLISSLLHIFLMGLCVIIIIWIICYYSKVNNDKIINEFKSFYRPDIIKDYIETQTKKIQNKKQ